VKKLIKKIIRLILSPFVFGDFLRFKSAGGNRRFSLNASDIYPCVKDKTVKTGFDRHYVYHTAWAARKVKEINPAYHADISSSLYFAGIVSAFTPVKFYDYRPAEISLPNLESREANLLSLPFADNSMGSLSCMHVIEHVGMGRYGEKMDYDGDLKAIKELKRVLAKGGSLLFVAPIGKIAKIEFNAHRIYTYKMITEIFGDLSLREFALIPETSGAMLFGQEAVNKSEQENYACGCFWFVKN
jgi:SAM-dependent methyltransferase